jgi:hypothetical protein
MKMLSVNGIEQMFSKAGAWKLDSSLAVGHPTSRNDFCQYTPGSIAMPSLELIIAKTTDDTASLCTYLTKELCKLTIDVT